jgi:hypothetical protein
VRLVVDLSVSVADYCEHSNGLPGFINVGCYLTSWAFISSSGTPLQIDNSNTIGGMATFPDNEPLISLVPIKSIM